MYICPNNENTNFDQLPTFYSEFQAWLNLRDTDTPAFFFVRIHERNALSFGLSEMMGSTSKIVDQDIRKGFITSNTFEVTQKTFHKYPTRSRPPCDTMST